MVVDALKEAEARMKGAVRSLEDDLAVIRTGRASPALIERLSVDYYGNPTPLMQLATISAPEPRLLTIRPFDPASLKDIERAILISDLGLTPNSDGKMKNIRGNSILIGSFRAISRTYSVRRVRMVWAWTRSVPAMLVPSSSAW